MSYGSYGVWCNPDTHTARCAPLPVSGDTLQRPFPYPQTIVPPNHRAIAPSLAGPSARVVVRADGRVEAAPLDVPGASPHPEVWGRYSERASALGIGVKVGRGS
jgi:hypothetical protein